MCTCDGWVQEKRTALHWAAFNGLFEATKQLLRRGALTETKDKNGKTPRDLALQYVETVFNFVRPKVS